MRIAIIIVLGACYYLGWLPASLVVPALLAVSLLRYPTAGPTRRRGGYIHEPSSASVGVNQGTADRVAMYTGSSNQPGSPWEAETVSTRLADLSKITALTSSTLLTGFSPGHPTTAAERLEAYSKPSRWADAKGDCGCEDAA